MVRVEGRPTTVGSFPPEVVAGEYDSDDGTVSSSPGYQLQVRSVLAGGTSLFYLGNNFHENISNVDDGYSEAFNAFSFVNATLPDGVNNVEAAFISVKDYEPNRVYEIEVFGRTVGGISGPQAFSVFAYNLEPIP